MCGPSAAQTQLSDEQNQFYQQMTTQDATEFSEDQGILTQMQSVYAPILAAGPNQDGFNAAETNSLNTTANEGVATNYASASTALKEQQAAEGGVAGAMPSGVDTQQDENLDASAAAQQSTEQQQIQQAGYTQGYNEFTQATNALEGTAGLLNPDGTASAANSAGSAAETTANQIAQESEGWMAPLAGAVGAVGGAATGAIIKNSGLGCWVAAELYGGWLNPRTILVRKWIFGDFCRTASGQFLSNVYLRHGEKTARAIRRFPVLRLVFLPIFNLALWRAKKSVKQ